ncbi:hypothetical protein NP511_02815 [Natrinema thermotolerans]|uniref:Uncharacterized protein n=1 Tax=Natrinema thermotolerans TaxID=121872 RepID=A0AAF0PAL2_9EURY|nr:hypothetical protein [Natrinema thermotolerans]QCC57496.1 hypothetical protein DVR14_02095 [Natrinema thermotolerans]WMT08573.1 hypothetical protein NP511_02815 [Natrinema thermotolerans]
MKEIRRRRLLSSAAATTGIAVFGAGCLDTFGNGSDGDDATEGDNEVDGTTDGTADLTPLERWVPATGSAELLFHYRDLTTVRGLEDSLQPDVIEDVPTLPDGRSGEFVEQLADGEPAVDSVCRFGSKGVAGNVVVTGSFDPDAVDTALESAAGEFERFERDDVAVAVSSETLVVSPSDGATLEALLAAGVDGADRRIDSNVNFAPMADHIGSSTFVWGEHERQSEAKSGGAGVAYTWSLDADTARYSLVQAHADPEKTDEFGQSVGEDVTIETDGTVGIASKTIPIESYTFQDLFAERGRSPPSSPPQVGVDIEPDYRSNTVTVTYVSGQNVDRLEVRDEDGRREVLTEVGQAATLEYESGASGEITVVASNSEAEVVVATRTYSF